MEGVTRSMSSQHNPILVALQDQLAMDALVKTISTRFLGAAAAEVDTEIRHALKLTGLFVGVDQCHLRLLSDSGPDLAYYWSARYGAAAPPTASDFHWADLRWAVAQLKRFESVRIPDVAALPPEAWAEREHWLARGLASVLLVVPL